MFTTRSRSGKNSTDAVEAVEAVADSQINSIASGAPIDVARFVTQFMVGRELEPMSAITSGQRFRGGIVTLTYLNDTFMLVRFDKVDGKNSYTQLIPWTAVATVILK